MISRPFVAVVGLLVAASLACSGGSSQAKNEKDLTVFVSKDGVIEVNGAETSLSALEGALQDAVAARAVILFAREPPRRDRGSISMMVLQAIRERPLRVRFCRNDFTDAIGPGGRLRPE